VKLVFFLLPYQPQHQNHQPFTSLVGPRGETRGALQSLSWTWTRTFPFSRTLCGLACFISVSFALLCPLFLRPFRPSSPPPNLPPSNEHCHVLILLTRSRPRTHLSMPTPVLHFCTLLPLAHITAVIICQSLFVSLLAIRCSSCCRLHTPSRSSFLTLGTLLLHTLPR
jgi:hypothetical protein